MGIDLRDSVVVVTGASSGIGRATARLLALRGASVVLAARGGDDLNEAAEECRRDGGEAVAMAADMADENQVKDLADRALTRLGRIDGWVNNAGVYLLGRLEEVPMEAFRRVIDTNLLGYVHGARAAIPIFREQGRGVLVNVASLASCVGQPYASAYVASKFAVRGLSECLRMELADVADIDVCTVMPGFVDTPLFQHAANYTGRMAQPAAEPLAAEKVAEAIAGVLERPQREVFVGARGALVQAAMLLAPGLVERKMAERTESRHFGDRSVGRTAGNLYNGRGGAVSGGWRQPPGGRHRRGLALGSLAVAALTAVPLGYLAWRQIQGRQMRGRQTPLSQGFGQRTPGRA